MWGVLGGSRSQLHPHLFDCSSLFPSQAPHRCAQWRQWSLAGALRGAAELVPRASAAKGFDGGMRQWAPMWPPLLPSSPARRALMWPPLLPSSPRRLLSQFAGSAPRATGAKLQLRCVHALHVSDEMPMRKLGGNVTILLAQGHRILLRTMSPKGDPMYLPEGE
jgi:hypothetical protein